MISLGPTFTFPHSNKSSVLLSSVENKNLKSDKNVCSHVQQNTKHTVKMKRDNLTKRKEGSVRISRSELWEKITPRHNGPVSHNYKVTWLARLPQAFPVTHKLDHVPVKLWCLGHFSWVIMPLTLVASNSKVQCTVSSGDKSRNNRGVSPIIKTSFWLKGGVEQIFKL